LPLSSKPKQPIEIAYSLSMGIGALFFKERDIATVRNNRPWAAGSGDKIKA
jgi:hypothetical protein